MRYVLCATIALTALFAGQARADDSTFAKIDTTMAQAREDQMPLLAPIAWGKAADAYDRAKDAAKRGRSAAKVDAAIKESLAALAGAADTMRVARTMFDSALTARSNALSAKADQLAAKSFATAEEQFNKAATALERGNSEKAQTQGAEATQTYRAAELDAIKGAILRDARHLLAQADQENVEKYAPVTLGQARASLAEADRAIVEDRYDTDRARLLAKQAKEQASHGLHLAAQIRAVNGGDRTWEELLLHSEAPIVDIANVLGVTPDLTNGVASTAAATVAAVKDSQRELAQLRVDLQERDERIGALERSLGETSKEAVALNTLLTEQQERRDQQARVEKLFAPNEAEVTRVGNAIVIRLVGLNFDSGGATIKAEHGALMLKVEQAIEILDDTIITVEGHTDSFGSDETNLELSQKRADAVRAFLLTNMTDLAPYRISAMGYGETRPIASNDTSEGRARNRRIDLVMSRSGD